MTEYNLQIEVAKIYGEIRLVNKELESIQEILHNQETRLGERITRIEEALGTSPSLILRLEHAQSHIKDLQVRLETLKDEVKVKDVAIEVREKTLITGWRITWGVITVLAGIAVWFFANVPTMFK